MPAPFARLLDRTAAVQYARLSDVTVCRLNGAPGFHGIYNAPDQSRFGLDAPGAPTLQYPACAELQDGEQITLGGGLYRVAGAPQRINDGREALAILVAL